MNNDENNPGKQSPAETEIEARIVAWVSGEASAFEAAELERLVREKPELAIFKRRIEAVRGLVADAVCPEKEPLRISPERRAKLLLAIGAQEAPAAAAQAAVPAAPSLAVAIQRHRTQRRWMLAVAACLVCGLFLSMTIPSFQLAKSEAKSRPVGVAVELPEFADDRSFERKEKVVEEKKRDHAVLNNARALAAAPANLGEPIAVQLPENVDSVELAQPQVAGAPTAQFSAGSELAGKLAADSEKGSPIALSPFEVHGTEDKGSYRANSTLAGTRVRAPAADVAAPKFSFSDQLLKDVGATNSEITLGIKPSEMAPVPFSTNAAPDAVATDGAASELNNVSDSISVVTAQELQDTVATDSKRIAGTGAINEAGAGGAIDAAKETAASVVVEDSAPSAGWIAASGGGKISSLAKQEVAGQQQAAGAVAVAGAYDEPTLLSPFTVDASLGNARAKPTPMGVGSPVVPGTKGPSAENAAETNASKEPVSTFSLHVSDVSFRLAQTALARGEVPDPPRIRPQEFYNRS